jgi:transposase
LKDFVIVADSGLMNNENIKLLEESNYKYIIGARIKSESKAIESWILSLEKAEGTFYQYPKTENSRLIIS